MVGALVAALLVSRRAGAEEPNAAQAHAKAANECSSERESQHLLGAVLDAGDGPASFGARYLNAHRSSSGCGGLGATLWYGYGAELRGQGAEAAVAQAVGKAGMAGDAAAFGLELATGAGTTFDRTIATGSVAFLFDFYYLGVGLSYAFPIGADRPAWLGGPELAVRVNVPLFTYDHHEEHYTR